MDRPVISWALSRWWRSVMLSSDLILTGWNMETSTGLVGHRQQTALGISKIFWPLLKLG